MAVHGKPFSKLRDVTRHVGSRSVTCRHPIQVNAPRLKPRRFVYALNLGGTGISPPDKSPLGQNTPGEKVPPGKQAATYSIAAVAGNEPF